MTPKQKKILEVAEELFYKLGYRETSMRDIAEAIGVKVASLYAHIESKEQLLLWICEDVHVRFTQIMDDVDNATLNTSEEKFRFFVKRHLEEVLFCIRKYKIYSYNYDKLSQENAAFFIDARNRYSEFVKNIFSEIIFSEKINGLAPDSSVASVLSTLNNVTKWLVKEELTEEEVDIVVQEYSERLLYGIKGKR